METKEFRNALITNIKQELKDWTKTQRDLKKIRKEEFRPKDKEGCYGLQSIVDEINGNRGTITNLIFNYRWILHGLKYWENRDIHSYKEYYAYALDYPEALEDWDNHPRYGNTELSYGDRRINEFRQWIAEKAKQYGLEFTSEMITELVNNK